MTKRKDFKKKIRARMDKTGESYTAARQALAVLGEGVCVACERSYALEELMEAGPAGSGQSRCKDRLRCVEAQQESPQYRQADLAAHGDGYEDDPVRDQEHTNEVMFFVYPPPEDLPPEDKLVKVRGFMEPMPPQLAAKVQNLRAEAKRALREESPDFMDVLEAMKPFHLSEEALKAALAEGRSEQEAAAQALFPKEATELIFNGTPPPSYTRTELDALFKQYAATNTQDLGVMDPKTGTVIRQLHYTCGCVLRYAVDVRLDLKSQYGEDGVRVFEEVLAAEESKHTQKRCSEAVRELKRGVRYDLAANTILMALTNEDDTVCFWPKTKRLHKPGDRTLYYANLVDTDFDAALKNGEITVEEYAKLSEDQRVYREQSRANAEAAKASANGGILPGFEVVDLS